MSQSLAGNGNQAKINRATTATPAPTSCAGSSPGSRPPPSPISRRPLVDAASAALRASRFSRESPLPKKQKPSKSRTVKSHRTTRETILSDHVAESGSGGARRPRRAAEARRLRTGGTASSVSAQSILRSNPRGDWGEAEDPGHLPLAALAPFGEPVRFFFRPNPLRGLFARSPPSMFLLQVRKSGAAHPRRTRREQSYRSPVDGNSITQARTFDNSSFFFAVTLTSAKVPRGSPKNLNPACKSADNDMRVFEFHTW